MICATFQVTLSGAVEGKAVWPKHLKPVAWHDDADRVRMKLGLYHKIDEVHDGMVEYRDISIQGPNGEPFFRCINSLRNHLASVVAPQQYRLVLEAVKGSLVAICTSSDKFKPGC